MSKYKPRENDGKKRSQVRVDSTELKKLINAADYAPMTIDQCRDKLQRLRDGAIDWALDLMAERAQQGLGVALMALQRANAELDRLDDKEFGIGGKPMNLTINGFDISSIEFGSNLRTTYREHHDQAAAAKERARWEATGEPAR